MDGSGYVVLGFFSFPTMEREEDSNYEEDIKLRATSYAGFDASVPYMGSSFAVLPRILFMSIAATWAIVRSQAKSTRTRSGGMWLCRQVLPDWS